MEQPKVWEKNELKVGGKRKRKTRRGKGARNKKQNNQVNLKIIGTNADGLSSKSHSFSNLVKSESPSIFMVQETKLRKMGFKVPGYQIFERIRSDKIGGGGLVMGISNEIECEPVLITKTDDSDIELLVVEINIKGNPVRIFTGYGPQENVSEDKVLEF